MSSSNLEDPSALFQSNTKSGKSISKDSIPFFASSFAITAKEYVSPTANDPYKYNPFSKSLSCPYSTICL
jgi:hypothetical protein